MDTRFDEYLRNRRTPEEKAELERNASRVTLTPGDPQEAALKRLVQHEAQNAQDGIVDMGGGNKTMSNRYGTGFVTPRAEGAAPGVIQDERGVVDMDALRKGKLSYQKDPLAGTPMGTVSGIDPGQTTAERQLAIARGQAQVQALPRGVTDAERGYTHDMGTAQRMLAARGGNGVPVMPGAEDTPWPPVESEVLVNGEPLVGVENAIPAMPSVAPAGVVAEGVPPVAAAAAGAVPAVPSVPTLAESGDLIPRRTTNPNATPVGPNKNTPEYMMEQAMRAARRGDSARAASLQSAASALQNAAASQGRESRDVATFNENVRQFETARGDRAGELATAREERASAAEAAANERAGERSEKAAASLAQKQESKDALDTKATSARHRLRALEAQGVITREQAKTISDIEDPQALVDEVARVAGTKPKENFIEHYDEVTGRVTRLDPEQYYLEEETLPSGKKRVVARLRVKPDEANKSATSAAETAEQSEAQKRVAKARARFLKK